MSWLAIWFLALACLDLARSSTVLGRHTPLAVGALVAVVLWPLAGLTGPADLVALAVCVVALAAWLWGSTAAVAGPPEHPPGVRRTVLTLLAPPVLATLAAGWATPLGGPLLTWFGWAHPPLLGSWPPEKAVAAVAAVLAQWGTGNGRVRLVKSEEPTSERKSNRNPVCRLRMEKKKRGTHASPSHRPLPILR